MRRICGQLSRWRTTKTLAALEIQRCFCVSTVESSESKGAVTTIPFTEAKEASSLPQPQNNTDVVTQSLPPVAEIKTISSSSSPAVPTPTTFNTRLCNQCAAMVKVPTRSVSYIVSQLKEGRTVPFLARYRKDASGGLDELQIYRIQKISEELETVEKSRVGMLKSLKQRKLLTATIVEALSKCTTMDELNDIYDPFRVKRDRIADTAREKGLEPIANTIVYAPLGTPAFEAALAKDVSSISKTVENPEKLIEAILKEKLMQCPPAREVADMLVRTRCTFEVRLVKTAPKDVSPDQWEALKQHYSNYQRSFRLNSISSKTLLTIERGAKKGVLAIKVAFSEDDNSTIAGIIVRNFPGSARLRRPSRRVEEASIIFEHFKSALKAAVKAIVHASVAAARRDLRLLAIKESIAYFAHNLRRLLLQRPLPVPLLAMDPGFKTGIKCILLDEHMAPKLKFVVNLNEAPKLRSSIRTVCEKHGIKKIVIGNGIGSRETELEVAAAIQEYKLEAEYAVVSETGASVYSASAIAGEEFPNLDILYRGAVSIGRRVQDPISELVKIPVKSIGIGLYQHDIPEKLLLRELQQTTQSCVSFVGVNVETASKYLLQTVPGISTKLAEAIAYNRMKIRRRSDLLKVPGMTPVLYQSIAGSLRVMHSAEALDRTIIHPEWYDAARKLLVLFNLKFENREGLATAYESAAKQKVVEKVKSIPAAERANMDKSTLTQLAQQEATAYNENIAAQCGVGVEALRLIIKALVQKNFDPRLSLKESGIFRHQAIELKSLKTGTSLVGVVTNVTPFGAFLDAGLGQDILLPARHEKFFKGINVGDVFENILVVVKGMSQTGNDDAYIKGSSAFRVSSSVGTKNNQVDAETAELQRRISINFDEMKRRNIEELENLDTSTSLENVLNSLREEKQKLLPTSIPEGWLQEKQQFGTKRASAEVTIAM